MLLNYTIKLITILAEVEILMKLLSQPYLRTSDQTGWGARQLVGDNLKLVWGEFSTMS